MIVKVKVFPRSSKSCVDGYRGDILIVRVNSAPEKGKANKEVLELLAKYFKVSRSEILIKKGLSTTHKIVEIATN